MEEELSRMANVMEIIGKAITTNTDFETIPVFWDMAEVFPDNMPRTCIVFNMKEWREDNTHCHYERQFDIGIIHNTDYSREITLRLSKYAEDMKELIDNLILTSNLDLTFLQGSQIYYLRNNKEDVESYKGTKTLFSSMIVLSYLLRY